MLPLDLVQTLAFAGIALFFGYGLRRAVPMLARYNLPAPVLGGLAVALTLWAARAQGLEPVTFDTTLQSPLMVAFFTTIGLGASVSLLRVGGPQVAWFFGLATLFAVAQNVVGAGVAVALGVDPLVGVLAGSVTLTGGPATGLAFAPLFEEAGVPGAATLAVAAAMVGIVSGGVIGAPLVTRLIERADRPGSRGLPDAGGSASDVVEARVDPPEPAAPEGEDAGAYVLLKTVAVILVAMWGGGYVSAAFEAWGVTLPATIGAMLVAAALRNLDDATGWLGLSMRSVDDVGEVALALFITLALMTLKLWEIAALALPLAVVLAVQIVMIALTVRLVWRAMGSDYEAAVMASGFVGFMLGTTANAMANMRALVERYGPAPRAFLVVPMVGAFFIDFTNALIVTAFVNMLR